MLELVRAIVALDCAGPLQSGIERLPLANREVRRCAA